MGETTKIPFFDLFTSCRQDAQLALVLEKSFVTSAVVDKEKRAMQVKVELPEPVAPVMISYLEAEIAKEFDLTTVHLLAGYKMPETVKAQKSTGGNDSGDVIMGKPIRKEAVPMRGLDLDSGTVIVSGRIFSVENKFFEKRGAWSIGFDITDDTYSIHVSKYVTEKELGEKLDASLKEGNYVTVQGKMSFDRFYNDTVLEPFNICRAEPKVRESHAEQQRVELHLHTKYSTLDALTEPAAAIKRAAKWGMKAVGITDHGGVQVFPEAYSAAKKNGIKVLLGVEGYYINNVDDRIAVSGESSKALSGEFVVFDLETTGLNSKTDRITELGAVKWANGQVVDKLQTFANPGMRIPKEVVELTGIHDEDVADAPSEEEVIRRFIEFVGDAPLVAHNAQFDMGFVAESCARLKIDFAPVFLDTLVLAQTLLPELKRYKLDIVAGNLGLPAFNHHRASDDATTTALMFGRFVTMLEEQGITGIDQVNPFVQERRIASDVRRQARHIILYVKDKVGLKNLYRLVGLSNTEHFKRVPIIPKNLLMQYREGLIIGSACESGELFNAVVSNKSDAELRRIASFYDFLEIQPICNNRFMIAAGKAKDDEQLREFNRRIVSLGDELGKPVVATGDVHFLDPEDEVYRHILLASRKFDDADKELPIYFKTTEEMLEEFAYLGEEKAFEVVVTNTQLIADMCEEVKPLPDDLYTPTIENSARDLEDMVRGKMHALYGDNPPEIVKERVDVELEAILGRQYDVIYMSAQKLVARSLENGYIVGSRGSVGSSIVAYMSGITEVNSLPAHYRCPKCKHSDFEAGKGYACGADMPDAVCPACGAPYVKDGYDIPFETFLGFGGTKVPDIDLNFSGEYQGQAHQHTVEMFGESQVFRAGTIGTIALKTAFGYVKNYLEERGIHVSRAEENRLAMGLVGVKRTTGQHPGGLVIIPQDKEVYDFCPVQYPADKADGNMRTTHFDYHKMESNLLKLDILGHDDPSMLRMLQDLTGIDPKTLPADDKETLGIFLSPKYLGLPEDDPVIGKTGTLAIPEFGTPFTREMLVDTKPQNVGTLIILSGFSHGTGVWLGNAKELIDSGTASVTECIGCRDDIMLYLINKGLEPKLAFKIMESVRKGKGLQTEWEETMSAHDVPEWYIESCRRIQYMFPKAHAVAYIMTALRIAWYKVHKPLAFYCAYFSIRGVGFDATYMTRGLETIKAKMKEIRAKQNTTAQEEDTYTTLELVYEFYMRGFRFENVDLYRSDATRFTMDGDALIPPFTALPGLGDTAAYDIVEHRNDKEFVSAEDLMLSCAKVSKTHLELLKEVGALGSLPDTSQMSLF